MKVHRFDPLSFVFGIVLVLMALGAAFRDQIDWDLGVWMFPAAVLVLGIGLLASSLRTAANESGEEDEPAIT